MNQNTTPKYAMLSPLPPAEEIFAKAGALSRALTALLIPLSRDGSNEAAYHGCVHAVEYGATVEALGTGAWNDILPFYGKRVGGMGGLYAATQHGMEEQAFREWCYGTPQPDLVDLGVEKPDGSGGTPANPGVPNPAVKELQDKVDTQQHEIDGLMSQLANRDRTISELTAKLAALQPTETGTGSGGPGGVA